MNTGRPFLVACAACLAVISLRPIECGDSTLWRRAIDPLIKAHEPPLELGAEKPIIMLKPFEVNKSILKDHSAANSKANPHTEDSEKIPGTGPEKENGRDKARSSDVENTESSKGNEDFHSDANDSKNYEAIGRNSHTNNVSSPDTEMGASQEESVVKNLKPKTDLTTTHKLENFFQVKPRKKDPPSVKKYKTIIKFQNFLMILKNQFGMQQDEIKNFEEWYYRLMNDVPTQDDYFRLNNLFRDFSNWMKENKKSYKFLKPETNDSEGLENGLIQEMIHLDLDEPIKAHEAPVEPGAEKPTTISKPFEVNKSILKDHSAANSKANPHTEDSEKIPGTGPEKENGRDKARSSDVENTESSKINEDFHSDANDSKNYEAIGRNSHTNNVSSPDTEMGASHEESVVKNLKPKTDLYIRSTTTSIQVT